VCAMKGCSGMYRCRIFVGYRSTHKGCTHLPAPRAHLPPYPYARFVHAGCAHATLTCFPLSPLHRLASVSYCLTFVCSCLRKTHSRAVRRPTAAAPAAPGTGTSSRAGESAACTFFTRSSQTCGSSGAKGSPNGQLVTPPPLYHAS
jgi:hypothetical protein